MQNILKEQNEEVSQMERQFEENRRRTEILEQNEMLEDLYNEQVCPSNLSLSVVIPTHSSSEQWICIVCSTFDKGYLLLPIPGGKYRINIPFDGEIRGVTG
jgi:hypothetical protein